MIRRAILCGAILLGAACAPAVRIDVGFEGSCPQSLDGVRQEEERKFRIFPSWRPAPGISEESVGRSTRLGFRVVNGSGAPQDVQLLVDWQYDDAPPRDRPSFRSREEFMSYRDFAVVREPGRGDWRETKAEVRDSVTVLRLSVPPGVTEVQWHPPYTYTQSEEFVNSLRPDARVAVEKIGESEKGRNLWLLRIADGSGGPKKPAMIRARVHGYESGGSYAMEGMVRWLLSDAEGARRALAKRVFHVMPMANPDGVAEGLGRLTAPRGCDLVWAAATRPDRAHAAQLAAVDRARPELFIDLHNWQSKEEDGLLDLDPAIRERFTLHMPDQKEFGKRWKVRDPRPVEALKPDQETMGLYCRRTFGAVSASFEFPWSGRTPEDARRTGARAVEALLKALDEAGRGR